MKKNTFLYLIIILFSISCKAQQYPLDTDYKTIPNYSYLKDTNNSLLPYVGNWKATYSGNEIILKIEKTDNHFRNFNIKKFYEDVLFMHYIIKNQQGNIVESTMNINTTDSNIISDMIFPSDNLISFTYTGGQCTVGWGSINLKMIDSTHFQWNYQPESTIITNKNCPDYPTGGITINLPYNPDYVDLVFTKQ
ncbi:hypothetical protein ACM39_00400 [Chryseobacterium sp. FH2]|uniref:DUF6705 family protein n=1 Tax=Chryseobacterium sp. FH2 TaxID=1674291 RepID=UPI00065AE286|nr:DUF6705 family protein [Chryseobacterium sp. FH2]KMQ69562.1 hypothetical protein ACM39_00400 [Chryseobacterium sp. FH2]